MKINLTNAISHFYPNPCFEQVYFEAIANALDANALNITVKIKIAAFDQPETLSVTITDDGDGFTKPRFDKFSRLLEVDNAAHKGLGRLVYLAYFKEVAVISHYNGKTRTFRFNSRFTGDNKETDAPLGQAKGTTLTFTSFAGERVKAYQYLKPKELKQAVLQHFIPVLFKKQQNRDNFGIVFELVTDKANPERDFYPDTQVLTPADLPEFKTTTIRDNDLDFFQAITVHYKIDHDTAKSKSLQTAICIDGRTLDHELVSKDAIPEGYQALFLFTSDYFLGKVDDSRQKLALANPQAERVLKSRLRAEINSILRKEIPVVDETNNKTKQYLASRYPHLEGYFPADTVGLIVRQEAVEGAQNSFLADQRSILDCTDLDDDKYEKALAVSARVLLEYILYRTRIISRLKTMDIANNEGDIHDLIVPRRKKYHSDQFGDAIFNNNVWMLDDKYMSYSAILSDMEMTEIIKEITLEGEGDDGRPDITLVFSGDPNTESKVDVVVVELKKHEVPLAKKEEVVSQLRQRARLLLKHYPNKIDRIWFYGITDIDSQFRVSLKEDDFKELFSHGTIFYKQQPIYAQEDGEKFLVDLYVLTYDTFITDAESRNSTFLRVLKEGVRRATVTQESKDSVTEGCSK